MALVDLDLDGDLDLLLDKSVFGGPDEALLYADGRFNSTGQLMSGSGPLAVGDLDNDFDQDVIFGDQIWLQSRKPFVTPGQSFFIRENRLPDEILYQVQTLPTTAIVTFTLDHVDKGGTDVTTNYGIDGDTGEIFVVDPSGLDYEQSNHSFTFTVTVTSTSGETATETIDATMVDTHLGTVFNSDLNNFNIDENSPAGTTLNIFPLASDVEVPFGDRITSFEITGGSNRFEEFVVDNKGILTFIGSELSFEDFPAGQEYIDVDIQAFDTENLTAGPGTVRVHINNVYEGPMFAADVEVAPGAILNFDASLDTDGDGVWQSTTAVQSLDWTLGSNVSRVSYPNSDNTQDYSRLRFSNERKQ